MTLEASNPDYAMMPPGLLDGPALDYAVGIVLSKESGWSSTYYSGMHLRGTKIFLNESGNSIWSPSTKWNQCGPLIERYGVSVSQTYDQGELRWSAWSADSSRTGSIIHKDLLVAICTAVVVGKLISVPIPVGIALVANLIKR